MKPQISAIITAGGNHTRFQSNKMLANFGGKPLFIHTLEKFSQAPSIDEIIVLVREKEITTYQQLIEKNKIKAKIVPAKTERIDSVYEGVLRAKGDYIITHDGCRPLTPVSLIETLVREVIKHKAVMTAVNPTATVKRGSAFFIEESLPRKITWIAQTPQGFERKLLLKAFAKAISEKHFVPTDDSEIVTRLGARVKIIPGHEINIKITFPQDLLIAEQLLKYSKPL